MSRKRLLVLIAGLLLIVGYLFRLHHEIGTKFEAHRWNLPSRVYSEPFYLYPGRRVTVERLEERLARLGYKKVSGPAREPGEYSRRGPSLSITLHRFSYPSEEFGGFPISLDFSGGRLESIRRLDTGESLETVRLEPELIASIFDEKMEDRTVVSLDQIPEELVQAVIAIEDERFYSHHGVDPIAIGRAFLTDLLHLRLVQGGSTITQQLVKNFFLTPRKSFVRKFNEIVMAALLELRYSKEEILEAYLNEIYFGQRGPVSVAGVEEASRLYFSKGVSQLSLAESALLAGLVRLPGEYSPRKNPAKAAERRNFVLKTMFEKNLITQEEYERGRREKLVIAPEGPPIVRAPFFIDLVQFQLREHYPSEVLKSEGLRIFTTLDMDLQERATAALVGRLGHLDRGREKRLEAAVLSVQPQTGAIRAYVGGREYAASQFDRLSLAHRQPGSAFKPFVYLTALADEGGQWTLASRIDDTAFSVPSGDGPWSPENYDRQEHGPVRLREALEESYNIATSRLAIDVGLERIVGMAQRAGIASPLEPYPAMALGSFEVTSLELAEAYTVFPNEGVRARPIAITDVVTPEGVVLERKGYAMERVVSPEVAYLMNSALKGVIERGTASSARALGFAGLAAGKTGTTSEWRDSWFVGYTPELLTLVWVGYDDGESTGLSGASGALPIWVDLMKGQGDSGRLDFKATEKIRLVRIDRETGLLAAPTCGESMEEAFIEGTEPKESCRSLPKP